MSHKPSSSYERFGWSLFSQAFPDEALRITIKWLRAASERAQQEPLMEPQFENQLHNARPCVRKLRRLLWNDQPFWTSILHKYGVLDLLEFRLNRQKVQLSVPLRGSLRVRQKVQSSVPLRGSLRVRQKVQLSVLA